MYKVTAPHTANSLTFPRNARNARNAGLCSPPNNALFFSSQPHVVTTCPAGETWPFSLVRQVSGFPTCPPPTSLFLPVSNL